MKKIILLAFLFSIPLLEIIGQEKEPLTKEDLKGFINSELESNFNSIQTNLSNLGNQIATISEAIEPERIQLPIHLDSRSINITETLPSGKYRLLISSDYACNDYDAKIKFTIENHSDEALDTSFLDTMNMQATKKNMGLAAPTCTFSYTKDFDIEKGTKVELAITIKDKNGNGREKSTIIYKSIKKWKWVTTLGVAAVSIVNSDTYKTEKINNEFVVTENGSQKLFQSTPIMQFSYINSSDNFIGVAPSGGIGFDLDNLSVFGGVSLYFGKNVFLTMGAAFHQQLRLDNKYDVGQIVSEEISEDDLNSSYYRVNPFVSLTFRLDKNIFKK